MSPRSGKIPENLSTTPFGESLVPPISHFVFRFRESSKRFVLEILTKNFAFNLSGSLFLVGLGCSLKWWYKDQLLVALLKQNLPALSEPQQKISWETGEYILREQNHQFAEKRGTISGANTIIDSPLKGTVNRNTSLNLSPSELPYFLGDYSSSAVPEGKQALWGTELLESSNDLNTVRFPIPYPQQLEASELPYSDHKVFQESLNNVLTPSIVPSNFANKTFDRLIERIDLYANHVVVKFKSPWEKHVYQRFVGVFSEPTQIAKFKFVVAIPSGEKPIVPSKHIQTNFTSNSPKNSIDQQSLKGESKVNKSSDSLEKRVFGTSDNIEKTLLSPAVPTGKETPDPKGVWSNKSVVPLALIGEANDTMKVNSALQKRNNFYSKDRFGKIGNIRENFPKYTLWKPLYPAHWFKLSARGLCILNKDKNLLTSSARSIDQVRGNSSLSGKASPKGKFTLGAGFPFIFLQPTPMFPKGNEGVWSCFGNSAVNSLNLLEPCINFTNRGDSHFRQRWPLTFGDSVSTGLIGTKTQQGKAHKHVGFSAFTPSGIIDRVNRSKADNKVALRSVLLNTRLVELRARVGALNALTVNHKRWNFDSENVLTPSMVQSVKNMEIGDKGLNFSPIEVQASYSYGLGKLKALGPLQGKEGEGQRTCSRIDSVNSASGIAEEQNLGFSPKGTANRIANLSMAKPIESTRIGELSYPLELTTTLAGCQPPIDTLVLNSYLDEIPYKLENTLLVPPWKKKSELLKPSALSAHLMAPSVIEQNSPTSFNDQVSTPLTQLKTAGTVTGSPLKGKALGVEKTSSLVSAQGDKTPTLDERPLEKALELVERKVATKPTLGLKRTAHQSDLSHVSTQPAHMASSDQVRTKARSETFFKKLQLVEIKHLLKNELQSLVNTLPLTFVDMPQNPASLVSIDSVNKPIDCIGSPLKGKANSALPRRDRNDVSSKKGLKPENLRINGDQMENSIDFVNKSVDSSETLQNSLSLLNNLGVTFNNLSSLTTPPVLLPITSDASFWTWNPSVHMPCGDQAKLNSGLLTHWLRQSRILKTGIFGGGKWAKKVLTVPLREKSVVPENNKMNASAMTKSLTKSMDTIFYFDPNNLTWEILQQPSYNQHFLSSFSKGVQNNLKIKIVTRQEKRINKIVLKQRKITIDKVENINSVDKGINFANRKSRFMSGYVYPDMQSHSLKANLYRWIPLTKNSLATPQRDIPVTAIPQNGFFPIGSANSASGAADTTFHHSMQLINANRQSPLGQSISRNVLGAHNIPQFERHKNKTLAKPIDFVNKSMGMSLQSTRKELENYCTIDKVNRLLYPNTFPGVHRFIDKVSLVGVEIPTAPTTFLSRYLQPEPLDAYQLASFPAAQAPHPLRPFPLKGKAKSINLSTTPFGGSLVPQLENSIDNPLSGKAKKSVKPLGTIDKVNTLNGLEHLRDQQQTLDMVKKIDTKSAAAFPLLQKKINTISIPLQSFDHVTKSQLAQKDSRKKDIDQQFPKGESKVNKPIDLVNNVAIDAKSNKDGVGLLNGTIDGVNRKDGVDRFINEVGGRNDTTLANPMELVTKSIGLNHHLASFPGFTKPNQLFWSLNQIAQGDDITSFKNLSPHSMESSNLLAAKMDADPVGVKNQKELAKNSSWSFPSRGSGKDTTLALIGSSPEGTANDTMESINLGESVNKSFTPTTGSGVDDGQGHKTVPTKKHFIDCSPRRTAYQGIVVQRNKLTKDFQPPKSSLEQSSAWGTICLGPENPLSNRQCHFFGQRRFSTIDTNDFQRDYLRQLGKETLAQSNYKAFTEKSTSVERAKILSFSKTVNSFFLKKRKYTYLLDEKDQWHLLFQEQLRTALEDPKKYPPLTPEEAKDHGPGRIKVSAPLMMARFPKKAAKANGMRYLPFHWQSPSGKSQGVALTFDLIGVKGLSTQSFSIDSVNSAFRGPGYGNNDSELPLPTLTPAQLQQAKLSTQRIDSSLQGKVNSAFGESLDLLTQSIGTSWRPLCCLGSSQLFTPRVGFPIDSPLKGAEIVEKVNKCEFVLTVPFREKSIVQLPEIVSHYPLFTEKDRLELHYAPSLNKSSLPIFHAANNLQWLTQEPLTVVSWAILSQWSFLVALLLWTEQMLLANVFPALSALEQLLLGATGIKSGDRTHVIRISQGDTPKFKDIAGVDGLLGELAELVLFLRGHRERLWNKKSSYGVLLTGPPGTGKTFLVRALANEARVPVLILSAGTLTVNKINSNKPSWAIRHAFRRAKQLAPCILFIDEIDALGQSRGKIVTDINEIVADTNSGSPGLKSCQKQAVSSTSTFPDEVLAYEQLQQNWPSASKSLVNEWQSSLKSTVLQESNNINRSSLCENEISDLWRSYGNYGEASTTSGTYNDNASHPQGVRASDVELNANKTQTQPGQSFRGNANDAAQRENTKRKFGPLTQLLVSMDGVSNLSGVLIMGATNRPESLDPALTRPGRFERVIQVEKPAEQKRVEILQLYSHNLGVKHQIPWSYLANRTVGLTAADLAVAMNYSSLKAIVQGSMHTIETIEYGLDSISRSLNTRIDSPLQGLRSRVNSASIKNNLDRQSPLGLASPSGLLAKQHSVSAGSEFLKPHEIRRLERLTQMAYYQAGKVVVQTLLPQHPPVALITLNLSGITTATSADTHIPVDGAFGTQWCSSLESRLIGLYGGKAASFLLECQQALAYPKPSQLLTKTPRELAGTIGEANTSQGSKPVPPIQSLASPVDSKTQLSNTSGESGIRERGLRDLMTKSLTESMESVHNSGPLKGKDVVDSATNQPFETQSADAPLVSWTDRAKLDSFSNNFGLSNQKGVSQIPLIRKVSDQKCACARTGFQSDIGNLEVQSATRLATAMINKWAFYSLQSSNIIRKKTQETGCLPTGSNHALSINSGPLKGKDCVNRGIDSLTFQQSQRKSKPPYGFLPERSSGQQLTMDCSSNVAISYPKKVVDTKALLMNKARKVGTDNLIPKRGKTKASTSIVPLWQNSSDSPLNGTVDFPLTGTVNTKVNNASSVPSLESYLRFLNLSESDTTHVSSNKLSKQPSGESLNNGTRKTSISNNEGELRKIHVANTPSGKRAQSYYPYGVRSQWVSNFLFDQQSPKGESKVDNASSWENKFASSKNATRADSNEQQMPKISQITLIANDNLAGNDLRFAISQSRSFLQRGGKQRSSYNDSRISIQDVGEGVSSQAEVLKLVNQFQLSNVQRDRFYPGWFRLYLPDIEATEFLKNVANYYFSLGLQTLTRPSLSEFTQVRHHWLSPKRDCQYDHETVNFSTDSVNSACKSLEKDDHMGNSLDSLELPLNEKNSVYIDTKLSAEPIDYVNTVEISIGSPLNGTINEIDLLQLHETSFCGIFDSSDYVEKSSLNVQNDKEGNETTSRKSRENLQHTSTLSSYFIASQKRRDAIVGQVPVGGKTRSIALIKNVFLCCGGNNLSIGVGLLRSAANRRTQLKVKSQHFSKPRQISKKICYPNVSMALWGFSRPWNMNRLINIGFRQDAILPPKGDNNVYNETVVKKNLSTKEHNSKLCYSTLDLLFDRMNKKMNGLSTQSFVLAVPSGEKPIVPFRQPNSASQGTIDLVDGKSGVSEGVGKKALLTESIRQQRISKNQGQGTIDEVNTNWNQNQNDNKSRDPLAYDSVKQGTKETNQLAQLDVSFFLSLEKQIFPVGYNDVSVVEKEFLYHALVNNCYAKAFFLVDENRQLIDYFADYLIRFQILRQHQILYLFSTVLLSCKKQP